MRPTLTRAFARFIALASALSLAGPLCSQVAKFRPVDEAAQDPSFASFREHLQRAVESHDKAFILSIVDPEIKLSFGGSYGLAAFKEIWFPEGSSSELWHELGTVLAMGGSFQTYPGEGTRFCAPYVFCNWPGGFDSFDYGAVVKQEAAVYAEHDRDGEILARLSYDVVRVTDWYVVTESDPYHPSWVRVQLQDGQEGYIPADDIRSAIDYRAAFMKKEDGRWVMTVLIAGD